MNEQIDYAEMLEIPVSTVNVVRKKSRKKRTEPEDLKDRVVQTVNERVREEVVDAPIEEELAATRVAASENLTEPIAEETPAPVKEKKKFFDSKILVAQFVAVLALCATIFLTNIFWKQSAINTFFAGLLNPAEQVQTETDDRVYTQLTAGSVVSDDSIVCAVSETGVLSFTGECSVYSPCSGKITDVAQGENGLYTVTIEHTGKFSTRISDLSRVYAAKGDNVYANIPVGYSAGEQAVSVSMFDQGNLISAYTVNENNDIVWNA